MTVGKPDDKVTDMTKNPTPIIPDAWIIESRGKNTSWLTLKIMDEMNMTQAQAFVTSLTAVRDFMVRSGKLA